MLCVSPNFGQPPRVFYVACAPKPTQKAVRESAAFFGRSPSPRLQSTSWKPSGLWPDTQELSRSVYLESTVRFAEGCPKNTWTCGKQLQSWSGPGTQMQYLIHRNPMKSVSDCWCPLCLQHSFTPFSRDDQKWAILYGGQNHQPILLAPIWFDHSMALIMLCLQVKYMLHPHMVGLCRSYYDTMKLGSCIANEYWWIWGYHYGESRGTFTDI